MTLLKKFYLSGIAMITLLLLTDSLVAQAMSQVKDSLLVNEFAEKDSVDIS